MPKIAILLCTHNGQHYLTEQLESFAIQTHTNWEVWVSDDGSQDDTLAIIASYREKWQDKLAAITTGPSKGFAANFLSLACKENIVADYYTYADQDDIWEKDKLARAFTWLQQVPENIPALYCSRTRLVDINNNELGLSPLFTKMPSFANALVQSIGGGNTMMFNNAAKELLSIAGKDIAICSHDWWTYMVVTGCGGKVFYDSYPTIRYRQHDNNLMGKNSGFIAHLVRLRMLFNNKFRIWNEQNIASLRCLYYKLTPENQGILQRFTMARNKKLIPRLLGFKHSGIYRQTLLGNIGLITAAIFKKI